MISAYLSLCYTQIMRMSIVLNGLLYAIVSSMYLCPCNVSIHSLLKYFHFIWAPILARNVEKKKVSWQITESSARNVKREISTFIISLEIAEQWSYYGRNTKGTHPEIVTNFNANCIRYFVVAHMNALNSVVCVFVNLFRIDNHFFT